MRKVLVDLNKNLITLNDKFKEIVYIFYKKQMKKLIENGISRISKFVFDFIDAIEHLKFDKAMNIALTFLDEADTLIDDLTWRFAHKTFDKLSVAIRELLQAIRAQVIFLDQYRQSTFAF